MGRWFAVIVAGLLVSPLLLVALLLAPGPALAHGGLVVTTPAEGQQVSTPLDAVTLTFTEKPATFAYFTVTAPTGARVDGGWSNAEPVPLTTPVTEYQLTDGVWQPQAYRTGFPVRVTVSHWPVPGTYVVGYQTVASDGDQVKGQIRFVYAGSPTPAPPNWQAPADQPQPELLAAAGPSTPPQAAAKPANATSVWVWLVPVLLLTAAVLLYLTVRPPKRRPARPPLRDEG
ncbi:hypothetical protein GCM10010435_48190 [Winogradskya consettensis]|uniref:CopC domain-containing protein n=1 Tax=Winogradskya consettensis TaxID=113560 RepID=A0A919VNP6_9ACTN|nr:copper resistance protein CopC [Actinoplanes consettensis]GIM72999.1 hypothetical protein Aco04nite_33120 [Actinoplanes consettensis]